MNGIYLRLLANELRPILVGTRIKRIAQQGRLVYVDVNAGQLVASFAPETAGVYHADTAVPTREFALKFRFLEGRIVDAVEQEEWRPILKLPLRGQSGLCITMSFVRNHQDFIVTDAGGKRDCVFRTREMPPGTKLNPDGITFKTLESMLDSPDPAKHLIEKIEGLDLDMAREIVEERTRFDSILNVLRGDPRTVHMVTVRPLRLSLFKPGAAKFESWNEAFKSGLTSSAEQGQEQEKESRIKSRHRKLATLKSALEGELLEAKKADEFRIKGETILANIATIEPTADKIILPNPGAPDQQLEIVMDARAGPQGSAQQYFDRYKKLKKKAAHVESRLGKVNKDIAQLEKGVIEEPKPAPPKKKVKDDVPDHFHRFTTRGGLEVLAGKDGRTNEELTFKFARPFDIFFHARGLGGSHVILRTAKKKPSKYDIYDAAAIAAFFSRAKNAKRVPVQYAERKYIKKARRGPPGAVYLIREEVIFADPGLPLGTKDQGGSEGQAN